ncbi:GNAT family N-acetyltransferase [Marinomonas posidonica]|uniref:GCN5-related N-acetyltransferase n=1 Tax=Marinomonas posidonica (strain CECT 7376 / NCIMB 14433 / IVIA-Po-181) TaxID=491952 RepID=F6D0T9_MARPP|nr:GNAT family N-acetyltransferase [Marinomonas posidonica]AEF55971.1 GCN5-related N-acetyltransferase [Marinomonas posidonica IVIA-Po-181]
MSALLILRPAKMSDSDDLLTWRNDSLTRQASHSMDPVSAADHQRWLEASLKATKQRRLWIAEFNECAVGTCRADKLEHAWLLSWTVAPGARGKGLAHQMLQAMLSQFDEPLEAQVKLGNQASIHVAQKAGFRLIKEEHGVLFFYRD